MPVGRVVSQHLHPFPRCPVISLAMRASGRWVLGLILVTALLGCGPRTVAEAEAKRDITWLVDHPTGDAVAALGRLADTDEKARAALEARAATDVNVYIAAWTAVTRDAPWGAAMLRGALADPTRADLASSALPRKDVRLAAFTADLENAVVRLAAGKRAVVIAGILASIGPSAHQAVERRIIDPKTRGVMCDGIALPETSGDAKSTLLAVPIEARDNPSCVTAVIEMAATEDVVSNWIATGAEIGLLGVAAKSGLACPRMAGIWKKALTERQPDAAMTVPLQRTISRCATILDPVLAEVLGTAPRARPIIISAIDPFGTELAAMRETCTALKKPSPAGESRLVRERANDATTHGCGFAR